jgi:hypothetical protein
MNVKAIRPTSATEKISETGFGFDTKSRTGFGSTERVVDCDELPRSARHVGKQNSKEAARTHHTPHRVRDAFVQISCTEIFVRLGGGAQCAGLTRT